MAHIGLNMLEHHPVPPCVPGDRNCKQQIAPKLQAVAHRRLFLSTQMLALRDSQLAPMITPIADGYAVYHGRDAMSSFARELGTSRPVTENELSALEQFYRDYAAPARIWVSDRTHSCLSEMLHARGYVATAHSVSWFCLLNSHSVPFGHRDINVVFVAAGLNERWVETVAAGFFENSGSVSARAVPRPFSNLFFALGCAPDDQRFLAQKHGEYVGGAVMNVDDGIAMLRTASTRFSHRNEGVQQTLIATRLRCALEQGARIAVSQTPPFGPSAHNLRKFGFQPFSSGCIMEKHVG